MEITYELNLSKYSKELLVALRNDGVITQDELDRELAKRGDSNEKPKS